MVEGSHVPSFGQQRSILMRGSGLREVGENCQAVRKQVSAVVGKQNLQGLYIALLCKKQPESQQHGPSLYDNIQNLLFM